MRARSSANGPEAVVLSNGNWYIKDEDVCATTDRQLSLQGLL